MSASIALLVVIGVVAAIIVVLIVLFIHRCFAKKKYHRKYETTKEKIKKSRDRVYTSVDTFEIPVSFKTVPAQTPTTKPNDKHKMSVTVTAPSEHSSPKSGASNFKSKTKIRKKLSLASLASQDGSQSSDKQRRICMTMMQHLRKQGKQVSSFSTRLVSLSDDYPSEQNTGTNQETGYRSDESDVSTASGISGFSSVSGRSGSSVGSYQLTGDELYDTSSIGSKKKIASKRGVKQEKKRYRKSGKVIFTTLYSEEDETLQVEIIRAFDLAPKRNSNELNPFVRLYLDPGKKQVHNTKYQKGTRNPYLNEKVTLRNIKKFSLNGYKIKIKAYHHGRLKKNELIGEVGIALSSLNIHLKETFNVSLFVRHKQITLGSILVSLCHQATFSKLEVLIQSAKDLPKRSTEIDPYVTATLYREDTMDRKETACVKNSRNPEFNEILEFDVATNSMTPLDTYSLAVTLINRNVIGKDEIIGHVIFSKITPQESAYHQWKSVVNEPHKRFIDWHNICCPTEI